MEKLKTANTFYALFLANIVKILCTILIPFTNGATMYLSSYSVVVLLTLFSDQIGFTSRIVLLSMVALLWITIIILSFISVKNREIQMVLSIFSIILAIFDCALPMVFSGVEAKALSLLVSSIIIMLNVSFLTKNKV